MVVLVALLLSACSSSSGSSASSGDFLTDGHAVRRALDAIAAKSGKPMRITTIGADGVSGLSVDVREPKNHFNVDRYTVTPNGTIAGPTPVKCHNRQRGDRKIALRRRSRKLVGDRRPAA